MQITPQNLHVGDIVDIGFSMVVVGKHENLKARMILRSIMLLDATHTQVSDPQTEVQEGTNESRPGMAEGKSQTTQPI